MRNKSRKMRLIPIDATKNIVQFNTQVATTTMQKIVIAQSVVPSSIDETNVATIANVEQGSMIRGISLQGRIYNESGVADSNSTLWFIRKNEGGNLPTPTLGQANVMGAQTWKNKVFHIEQAITGSQVSGWPMGLISIKFPKRFHVMKQGDVWELFVGNNTGNSIRFCGIALYKWYR